MTTPPPAGVEISAPAKLNLGLDVLARREDGFHDIATIFQAIDVQDTLRLSSADGIDLHCAIDDLANNENLAFRALHMLRESTKTRTGAHVELVKRIPAASGLGGASSDAAAALIAGRELWRLPVLDAQLHDLASQLGSDVPFFLKGGRALGTGRGDILQALPIHHALWFTIVVPAITIPHKTETLYAQLTPRDFGDGARIDWQATRIAAGMPVDPELLVNAFTRPLYEIEPELAELPHRMREAGARNVALSGAGPTHYAMFSHPDEAQAVAIRLHAGLAPGERIYVARSLPERPTSRQPL